MNDAKETGKLSDSELEDLVASTDTGGRNPSNKFIMNLILGTALAWSLFQIWIASPLPYKVGFGVFSSTEARSIHLAFALFLAFLAYPAFKNSPRQTIPIPDWVLGIVGALCSLYLFIFNTELVGNFLSGSESLKSLFGTRLSERPANPTIPDIAVTVVGILILLEATRRALGPPLMVIASIFLFYTFLGPFAPSILAWKGASFGAVAYHQWISTEGVFGIALGVSTDLVFLFVLFGALLDKAGAGNYFIKVAFSLMGHFRGGPAKAAVVASGATGLISGSSIANVVTTGTFTIPMMRRVGFSPEKAGAVEVASSVNGQIMPPVMGAAAFLMVEYVNISYFEVVKHAFIPAVISYIALVYIVHLEAMKQNMYGLPRAGDVRSLLKGLVAFLLTAAILFGGAYAIQFVGGSVLGDATPMLRFIVALAATAGIIVFYLVAARALPEQGRLWGLSLIGLVVISLVFGAFALYEFVGVVQEFAQENTIWYIAGLMGIAYVAISWYCAKFPELELDDPNEPVVSLPEPRPTIKSGLHFLLPVGLLIWCLMVQRLSPSLSAFWATAFMIFILLTQRTLFAMFRGEGTNGTMKRGFIELIEGLIAGARNMIGIGIATAAAGIIVGAVSQTGVGAKFAALVEVLSAGNILLILLFTGILSLILGMGLPTTANYIVVSSLLAPVIVSLGEQNGLLVPLIAVHLFVFYFGIMADVTPPVGLASFAAAAVSGGDPIRTGFVAFFYSLRTALLPFLFIFNTDLILWNIDPTVANIAPIFIIATIAILLFTAGTQGFFVSRSKWYESVALVLIAFTLFRPGFWMDMVYPPNEEVPSNQLVQLAGELKEGDEIRVVLNAESDDGSPIQLTRIVELGEGTNGAERLESFGLTVIEDNGKMLVDNATFDSPAEKAGFEFDQEFATVMKPLPQPAKQLFFIPALLLLGCIIFLQWGRREPNSAPESATA